MSHLDERQRRAIEMEATGLVAVGRQDGFIVMDKLLHDNERERLGLGMVALTEAAAEEYLRVTVHPGYYDSYEIREVAAGRLVPVVSS